MLLNLNYAKQKNMPSSVISVIHYDPGSSVMRIIFISGMTYEYESVPEKVYKAMKSCRSKELI